MTTVSSHCDLNILLSLPSSPLPLFPLFSPSFPAASMKVRWRSCCNRYMPSNALLYSKSSSTRYPPSPAPPTSSPFPPSTSSSSLYSTHISLPDQDALSRANRSKEEETRRVASEVVSPSFFPSLFFTCVRLLIRS